MQSIVLGIFLCVIAIICSIIVTRWIFFKSSTVIKKEEYEETFHINVVGNIIFAMGYLEEYEKLTTDETSSLYTKEMYLYEAFAHLKFAKIYMEMMNIPNPDKGKFEQGIKGVSSSVIINACHVLSSNAKKLETYIADFDDEEMKKTVRNIIDGLEPYL